MHKKRSIVTNGHYILFTLALSAVIGSPAPPALRSGCF